MLLLGSLLAATPPGAPQGEQPKQPLDEVVRHFAEKEVEYATAHRLYDYELSVRVQEVDSAGNVVGEFEQVGQVYLDPSDRRRMRLEENPRIDLTKLEISRLELGEFDFIPLFIDLSPEQLPNYDVTYLTTERLDEVDTFLFRLQPNRPVRPGETMFEGIVWVDAHKLDIVRLHGRWLPVHSTGALKEYFRRVEVFREPVDGFLFPTYVRADDVLEVRDFPLNARLVVRFRNHKRRGGAASIPGGAVGKPTAQLPPTDQSQVCDGSRIRIPDASVGAVVVAEVVEVGPAPGSWSGIAPAPQRVRYKVVEVLKGRFVEENIEVTHYVVHNSLTADTSTPQLSPKIFFPGNRLILFLGGLGKSWTLSDENCGVLLANSENIAMVRGLLSAQSQ